jgi:ABC-2 type transport system ATP-binding protein
LTDFPPGLETFALRLENDGSDLVYVYDRKSEHTGIATLLRTLADAGLRFRDLETRQSSLEDIFISLVKDAP